jgi:hypothetical protein
VLHFERRSHFSGGARNRRKSETAGIRWRRFALTALSPLFHREIDSWAGQKQKASSKAGQHEPDWRFGVARLSRWSESNQEIHPPHHTPMGSGRGVERWLGNKGLEPQRHRGHRGNSHELLNCGLHGYRLYFLSLWPLCLCGSQRISLSDLRLEPKAFCLGTRLRSPSRTPSHIPAMPRKN